MLTLLEGEIQDGRQLQKRNVENDIMFIFVGIKHNNYVIYRFVLFAAG
jgi:hypothetical protein